MRGGRLNDPRFGSRLRGGGPWAELLGARLARLRRVHGLGTRSSDLRTDLFRPPADPRQPRLL
jgi:hypothetical protein